LFFNFIGNSYKVKKTLRGIALRRSCNMSLMRPAAGGESRKRDSIFMQIKKGEKFVEKVRYMISDAADMVHVETHVLRYWEEELDLAIPRNEMGHRYYTRDNIKEFQKIKELKEKGYQLKAIRMILHNGKLEELPPTFVSGKQAVESKEMVAALSPEERMMQFREIMSDIVGQAIALNNEELSQMLGKDMQELVLKEMNYLMREQDNAQEERYRKLDAAIRGSMKRKPIFEKSIKNKK